MFWCFDTEYLCSTLNFIKETQGRICNDSLDNLDMFIYLVALVLLLGQKVSEVKWLARYWHFD